MINSQTLTPALFRDLDALAGEMLFFDAVIDEANGIVTLNDPEADQLEVQRARVQCWRWSPDVTPQEVRKTAERLYISRRRVEALLDARV